MKRIRALRIMADGTLRLMYLYTTISAVRDVVGTPLDNINLGVSNTVAYIKRDLRGELPENRRLPGVHGDVLVTGGNGSFMDNITADSVNEIKRKYHLKG